MGDGGGGGGDGTISRVPDGLLGAGVTAGEGGMGGKGRLLVNMANSGTCIVSSCVKGGVWSDNVARRLRGEASDKVSNGGGTGDIGIAIGIKRGAEQGPESSRSSSTSNATVKSRSSDSSKAKPREVEEERAVVDTGMLKAPGRESVLLE